MPMQRFAVRLPRRHDGKRCAAAESFWNFPEIKSGESEELMPSAEIKCRQQCPSLLAKPTHVSLSNPAHVQVLPPSPARRALSSRAAVRQRGPRTGWVRSGSDLLLARPGLFA